MQSDTDEQVATYVPICFDFSKAKVIAYLGEVSGNEN